ncbi:MAG: hypothetical protein JNL93_17970 [Pelomonas sp.]|nr:hypothetical protein [Roseateles sp.]
MTLITPARLGLMSALCLVAAAVIAFSEEAQAATSACEDTPALQKRLNDFDARWNASDAWGLTAQFAPDGSLGAESAAGRQAVYRELVERLGRSQAPRQTRVVRATPVGAACLVDVQVRSGERSEAGLFLLAASREGGIVAMR